MNRYRTLWADRVLPRGGLISGGTMNETAQTGEGPPMERRGARRRIGPVLAVVAGLAGCTPLLNPHQAAQTRDILSPSASLSQRAMTALGRGDLSGAEHDALEALRQNPRDPNAQLVAGLVLQSTGRYAGARRYYQAILREHPAATIILPGSDGNGHPHAVAEIAEANLGAVDKILGEPQQAPFAGSSTGGGAVETPVAMTRPVAAEAEADVAGRFRILKELLNAGLITAEEYTERRNANLGALLPYSEPPPARGLERPIPPDAAVIDRLRAIKAAVRTDEMTPDQQSAERAVILDALLPADPGERVPPPHAPQDMLAAATAVGRVERMYARGLVTAAEVAREKTAIQRALSNHLAGQPVVGTATGLAYGPPPTVQTAPMVAKAEMAQAHLRHGWGVSLAIANSQAAAKRLAPGIKAKFPEELGDKEFRVGRIVYRDGRHRWRVIAGPFANREAALTMCRRLRLHRQRCYLARY
jgi:hypothetical protein